MPHLGTNGFISRDETGDWFVITTAETGEEATKTSEWIKADSGMEIRP